jgi:hypothetical protein
MRAKACDAETSKKKDEYIMAMRYRVFPEKIIDSR